MQMPRGGKRLGLFEGEGFGLKSEVGGRASCLGALDTKLRRNFSFALKGSGKALEGFSQDRDVIRASEGSLSWVCGERPAQGSVALIHVALGVAGGVERVGRCPRFWTKAVAPGWDTGKW